MKGTISAWKARIDRLRAYLNEAGLAAALLSRPEHLRYFAGLRGGGLGPAFLILTARAAVLVLPSDSEREEGSDALEIDVATYTSYRHDRLVPAGAAGAEEVRRCVGALRIHQAIGVELDHLPAAVVTALDLASLADLGPELTEWRTVKDPFEQGAIRRNVALLDGAFESVGEVIAAGTTELELEGVIRAALVENVTEPVGFVGNIASGTRTALPDPRASTRPLEPGDLVLVDLYPILDGYAADYTRMWVIGEPDSQQVERFGVVVSALAAAEQLLAPGVAATVIDRTVRDTLAQAGGYDRTMKHQTGHGFGLFAWEEPWIGGDSDRILVPGNVVAIEPGLYIRDWGGLRLEANYIITEEGFERLDRYPVALGVAG